MRTRASARRAAPSRMNIDKPIRTIAKRERKPRFKGIKRGTLVTPQSLRAPTMMLEKPANGSGGVSLEPGTALRVLGSQPGWHRVETMGADKENGWIPTPVGSELRPQLNVPGCDKGYLEFDRVVGPTYTGPVRVEDINQGYLGDCFLVGSLAALAHAKPGKIRDAIRKGDKPGTYKVTLHRVGENGRDYGTREIEIDNVFPTKGDHLLYAQGGGSTNERYHIEEFNSGDRPLWPAILEKAFATMLGGYDQLDKGGIESTVFRGVAGGSVEELDIGRPGSEDNMRALGDLDLALKMGLPVTAATKSRKVLPNIYDNHVYVAVGVDENNVTLRNPHDPRKTLTLSHKDFCRAFEGMTVGCVERA